jgi:hypothetical protein
MNNNVEWTAFGLKQHLTQARIVKWERNNDGIKVAYKPFSSEQILWYVVKDASKWISAVELFPELANLVAGDKRFHKFTPTWKAAILAEQF